MRIDLTFDGSDFYVDFDLTLLEDGHYRVDQTPLFPEPADYGDVIEASLDESGRLHFKRVVAKSDLVLFSSVLGPKLLESEMLDVLMERVFDDGGYAVLQATSLFKVFLPETSKLDLKKELDRIAEDESG